MFCDIRDFTTIAESQPPEETIELLNNYYTLMFDAIGGDGGIVNQMVGDGLMAIFGAPLPLTTIGVRAVRAALEMVEMIRLFNVEQAARGRRQIRIGIGIASGEVVAGYTGTQHRATYTCIGDTVNLAARLEAHTKVLRPADPDRREHAAWTGRRLPARSAWRSADQRQNAAGVRVLRAGRLARSRDGLTCGCSPRHRRAQIAIARVLHAASPTWASRRRGRHARPRPLRHRIATRIVGSHHGPR